MVNVMTPILIFILGSVIGLGVAVSLYRRRRHQQARAYTSAKQALAQNPNDHALKGRFIICGRRYYRNLKRFKLSTNIEQAVAQDLMSIVGTPDRENANHY
jgi:predicted histidine transporter YuiF (NhaC family)